MKPLALALAVTLAIGAPLAVTAQTAAPAAAPAAAKPAPAWVEASNRHAQVLLAAQLKYQPEAASFFGIPGFDERVSDLGPDYQARFRKDTEAAKAELQRRLAAEKDPNVRQDLALMISAADDAIASSATYERLTLPFSDTPQTVFQGITALLSDQTPPERRLKALDRLNAYAGITPGTTPITELARARYEERAVNKALLRPTKLEVEQALGNVKTYLDGIRALFTKYEVKGAEPALAALEKQFTAYEAWMRGTVLPTARTETILPPELYALQLKQVGIDVPPLELLQRARLAFMETRAQMQQMAPLVAREKGLKVTDYREVLKALKRETIPNDQLEARYRVVIDQIDPIIRRERIVDVPNRPMVMRLGTPAESAAQPAPHFKPAPLVGNTGQQGQFILPTSNPAVAGEGYDDFNHPAVVWTLSAHEGRPGHELQFTAMVERGVSLARTLFAFNSVNVEGWALYAEAEMVPYEPIEGQFIALQFRLLRAARAMLDPMLNLGLITREEAGRILREDVGLSEAMTRQELDRYTFNAPGQAGSYFYGYARILELRAETEVALGSKFDRLAFNNFLLDQGMLPPDLLAKAVREQFIPAQRAKR